MESTRPGTEWKLVSDKDHLHHAEDSVPLSDDSGKKKKKPPCVASPSTLQSLHYSIPCSSTQFISPK